MSFQGNEKLVTCPYNPSHQILPLRLAKHLVKCKKMYPDLDMEICPYNATHHVLKENMTIHLTECEGRDTMERDIYRRQQDMLERTSTTGSVKSSSPSSNFSNSNFDMSKFRRTNVIEPNFVPCSNEDWETESDARPVSIESSSLLKPQPRCVPVGFGKSGRAEWRRIDMLRVARLLNNEPIDDLLFPTMEGGEISVSELMGGVNQYYDNEELHNQNVREERRTVPVMSSKQEQIHKSLMNPKEKLRIPRMAANLGQMNGGNMESNPPVKEGKKEEKGWCNMGGVQGDGGVWEQPRPKGRGRPIEVTAKVVAQVKEESSIAYTNESDSQYDDYDSFLMGLQETSKKDVDFTSTKQEDWPELGLGAGRGKRIANACLPNDNESGGDRCRTKARSPNRSYMKSFNSVGLGRGLKIAQVPKN